jgi:hypothetical protein
VSAVGGRRVVAEYSADEAGRSRRSKPRFDLEHEAAPISKLAFETISEP